MLSEESVTSISNYDYEDFAEWILEGLIKYLIRNEEGENNIEAFKPVEVFIGKEEDITEDLIAISSVLPGEALRSLKHGINLALSRVPAIQEYLPVLDALIRLCIGVKVYNSVNIIGSKVNEFSYCLDDKGARHGLYSLALLAMDALIGNENKEMCKYVTGLVHEINFPAILSDTAFFSLCRADRESFPEHFNSLIPFFDKAIEENRLSEEQTIVFATTFIGLVNLDLIGKILQQIKSYQGEWFLKGMLSFLNSPLERVIDQDDIDELYIRKRDDNYALPVHVNLDYEENFYGASSLRSFFDTHLRIARMTKNDKPMIHSGQKLVPLMDLIGPVTAAMEQILEYDDPMEYVEEPDPSMGLRGLVTEMKYMQQGDRKGIKDTWIDICYFMGSGKFLEARV